jgi:hypothetical protein
VVEQETAEVGTCLASANDHSVDIESRFGLVFGCPEVGIGVVVDGDCADGLAVIDGEVTVLIGDAPGNGLGRNRLLPLIEAKCCEPGSGVDVEVGYGLRVLRRGFADGEQLSFPRS